MYTTALSEIQISENQLYMYVCNKIPENNKINPHPYDYHPFPTNICLSWSQDHWVIIDFGDSRLSLRSLLVHVLRVYLDDDVEIALLEGYPTIP